MVPRVNLGAALRSTSQSVGHPILLVNTSLSLNPVDHVSISDAANVMRGQIVVGMHGKGKNPCIKQGVNCALQLRVQASGERVFYYPCFTAQSNAAEAALNYTP
jgi:hypothetical protein